MPESAESMTTYQYAGNNAVMGNDPMGNINRLPVAPEMSYGNGVGDNLNDLGPGSYLGGGGGGDYSAEWTQILASYGFNGVIMPNTVMANPTSINVAALNSVTASLNDINDGTAIPGGGIYVNITDGIFSSAAVDPYANGQIANNLNLTNEDINAIATIELGILQNSNTNSGRDDNTTADEAGDIVDDIDKANSAAEATSLFTKNAGILAASEFLEKVVGSSGGRYMPLISAGINSYKYSTGEISTGEYDYDQIGVAGGIAVDAEFGAAYGGAYGAAAGLLFGTGWTLSYQSGQIQAAQTQNAVQTNTVLIQTLMSEPPPGY